MDLRSRGGRVEHSGRARYGREAAFSRQDAKNAKGFLFQEPLPTCRRYSLRSLRLCERLFFSQGDSSVPRKGGSIMRRLAILLCTVAVLGLCSCDWLIPDIDPDPTPGETVVLRRLRVWRRSRVGVCTDTRIPGSGLAMQHRASFYGELWSSLRSSAMSSLTVTILSIRCAF